MRISKEEADQMLEAAKPLMEWLVKSGLPHSCIVVDVDRVELLQGIAMRQTQNMGGALKSWGPSTEES